MSNKKFPGDADGGDRPSPEVRFEREEDQEPSASALVHLSRIKIGRGDWDVTAEVPHRYSGLAVRAVVCSIAALSSALGPALLIQVLAGAGAPWGVTVGLSAVAMLLPVFYVIRGTKA